MSTMMRDAIGRKVLTADEATEVGEVKAYVVDQPPRHVVAVHVAGRAKSAQLVDWSAISGFGPDAVMIEGETALREASTEREIQMASHDIDLLGARVVDVDGFDRGEVLDATFDPETGELVGFWTAEVEVPASDVRSLGSYALVVEVPSGRRG